MWALRRASIHLRNRCLSLETTRICTVKSEIVSCYCENFITEFTQPQVKRRFHDKSSLDYSNSSSVVRLISSLAGDDNAVVEDSSSCPETRRDNESMVEGESDADEKKCPKTEAISGWTQVMLSAKEFAKAYDESVEAGNEVSSTVRSLQSRRIFKKARKNKRHKYVVSSLAGDDNAVLEDSSSWPETQRHPEWTSEGVNVFESDDLSVEVLEGESAVDGKKSPKTEAISGFTQVILSASAKELSKALDKWVEAGNEVTRTEVSSTVKILQSRRIFDKACKLYEWLESRENLEFTENEYARRVDFIAKEEGSFMAEDYIHQIPESFRNEIVYTSLLRNYVLATDVNESEKLFNEMKDLFPLTCISCNQMLFLYKKTDRKKIADILEFMEKESIKANKATYQILIDVKGQSGHIWGMEQIFEVMKYNGVEPTLRNRASLAQYYAASGFKEKAEAVFKDMEGGDLVKNRAACYHLLPVYASLGRGDEVGRIWKECESDPSVGECIVAVKASGQLKRIEEAEAVFAKMLNTHYTLERRPSSYHYAILLDVYADHKMVSEAEDLFKRMRDSCVAIHIRAWDALMKLYISVGEVEKADTVLEEAISKTRPSIASFLKILEVYAARGDVHDAEKIFSKMRKAGYTKRPRPYHSLLCAYINAKAPVDGFDMRLRIDNVVPDKKMERLLARVAAFRSPVDSGALVDS